MRISTGTIYDSGVSSMQQQTQALVKTQQQIASGRRILTPADDPVAAARVLEVSQSQALNAQYGANAGAAADSLALEESVLGSIWGVLQDVRAAVISAGNGAYSSSDRASLADEVSGRYQQLLALANSTDGGGQYLFSGYQGGIRPFGESAPGTVAYYGDQGQRLIQVGASRQIAVSDSGSDVFQRIPNGNGSFVVQAGANGGSAVIDAGSVLDASAWNAAANSKNLSIVFSVNAGVATYDIIDNAAGGASLLAAPRPYASGSSIRLASDGPPAADFGAQLTISGAPADGDSFSINASTHQDMFATVSALVQLLKTAPRGAALTNGLARAHTDLDQALANVSTLRAASGARMKELDSIIGDGEDRALQFSQTLSRLQDLDYAKAASDLTLQQVNLQAAQKSFVQVAGLSLFDYL